MASISRTLGNRDHKPAGNEIRFAGDERKDKLYEPKHKQKVVRVLTVVAYVIFVSMAAILLSLYYTFIWDPKDIRMRMKPECANIKLPNFHTTPSIMNETQTENMTTKLLTVANEQSSLSEVTTTPRQKDLLTILTEIAESSTTPLPTTFEDLQTSLSTETKEISIKMHSSVN